jgi:hypothetical protein
MNEEKDRKMSETDIVKHGVRKRSKLYKLLKNQVYFTQI